MRLLGLTLFVSAFFMSIQTYGEVFDYCAQSYSSCRLEELASYSGSQLPYTTWNGQPVISAVVYLPLCNFIANDCVIITTQDAGPPTQVSPPTLQASVPIDSPVCKPGSIIRTDNQALGESLALVGTPFHLVYFSDRQIDRADDRSINVNLTGATVQNIFQVVLKVQVADQTFNKTFPGSINQNYLYQWNGLDASGAVTATQNAVMTLSYVNPSGGITQGTSVTMPIGHWETTLFGLGGWGIDILHRYDVLNKRLYLGSGLTRNVVATTYKNGLMVTSIDGSEVYLFDQNGQHLSTLDGLTGITKYTFQYDSKGQIISVTDRFLNKTVVNRSGNIPVSITSPFGQVTKLGVDQSGYLSSITNPNNEAYAMTYSSGGLLQSMLAPNGHLSTMTYDANGLLLKDFGQAGNYTALLKILNGDQETVSAATALGRTTTLQITSTSDGSTQQVTDPAGLVSMDTDNHQGTSSSSGPTGVAVETVNAQDARYGWLSPIPSVKTTSISGTALSLVSRTTQAATFSNPSDPLTLQEFTTKTTLQNDPARTATLDYLAAQKMLTSTSPVGRKIIQTYNDQGLASSLQIGDLTPALFNYDSHGRTISISQGTRSTNFSYDHFGNVSSVQDSLGQITKYSYDGAGRVVSETRPDGKSIGFAYDGVGDLVSMTPPGRMPHRFLYDTLELISTYLPPALVFRGSQKSTPTIYNYNLDKQLTSINRPDGKTIQYNYDNTSGVLNSISAPDASIQMSHSPQTGLVTQATSFDNVTTDYSYVGPLLASAVNSGAIQGRINFGYAPDFKLSTLSVQSAAALNFTYDNDGLLTAIGTESLNRSLSTGLIVGMMNGRISEAINYNQFGEIISDKYLFDSKPILSWEIRRDILGRIVEKIETLQNKVHSRFDYSYDHAGRLVGVMLNGFPISRYAYDANGNRISLNNGDSRFDISDREKISYDSQDRLIQMGYTKYFYNDNGDLTEKLDLRGNKEMTFNYDSFGNLKSVVKMKSDHDDDSDHRQKNDHNRKSLNIQYLVDAQNRRVGKKVNGILVEQYVYLNQLQIAAELDGSGNLIKQFVYGTKPNIPDYMITKDGVFQIISNQVGSPRFVIDVSTGKIKESLYMDEFGRVLEDSNPGFIPFGFAGGLYDHDTKLVRFGARDYDPDIGRWLSKDSILFNGSDTNLYGYGLQDPVNKIDPTGNDPVTGGLICAALTGLAGTANGVETIRQFRSLLDNFNTQKNAIENNSGLNECEKEGAISKLNNQFQLNVNKLVANFLTPNPFVSIPVAAACLAAIAAP